MIKLDELIKKQISAIKKLNESQYKDIEQVVKNMTNDYKKITRNIDKYFDNFYDKVDDFLSRTEYSDPAWEWQKKNKIATR